MSGHSADSIREPGPLCAGAGFLHKPFTRAALAAKVREILDSSR